MDIIAQADLQEPGHVQEIRQIFFEAAIRKDFQSTEEKDRFFETWTKPYFDHHPEHFLLAIEDGKVLGYLTGCLESSEMLPWFKDRHGGLALFQDLLPLFPAHLHINLTEGARGKDIGSRLVERFLEHGLSTHVITGAESRNLSFYRKNGFTSESVRELDGVPVRFMGRQSS